MYNPWFGGWNLGTLSGTRPDLGTGAMTFTSTTGNLYPAAWVATSDLEGIATANFASNFRYPVPPGFAAWGVGMTWDPVNLGSSVVLSNGNLTVAGPATTWGAARALAAKGSGKWYWEIVLTSIGHSGTSDSMGLGMVNSSATLNGPLFPGTTGWVIYGNHGVQNLTGFPNGFNYDMTPSTNNAWRITIGTAGHNTGKWYFEVTGVAVAHVGGAGGAAIGVANHFQLLAALNTGGGDQLGGVGGNSICNFNNGGIYFRGGSVSATGDTINTADIVGVAVDVDALRVWFYNSRTARWNGDVVANQNPATGVGGAAFSPMTLPVYPAAQVLAWAGATAGDQFTLNTGGPFTNPKPTGFGAWSQ
jgi:hypothetical protein